MSPRFSRIGWGDPTFPPFWTRVHLSPWRNESELWYGREYWLTLTPPVFPFTPMERRL